MSAAPQHPPLLLAGTRPRWGRPEGRRVAGLLGVVALLHALGWGGLALLLAGHDGGAAPRALGAGVALTAYLLGVRHAFDVDHIAVIDGATRKLSGDGQRALSVGFWFSLGHSSVVFAMAVLVATGARAASALVADGAAVHEALGVLGTGASALFLWAVGLVNLVALVGMLRWRRRLAGGAAASGVEVGPVGGPLAGLLRRATRGLRSPVQAYPAGLLMGLGFDTATEVALLAMAGTAAVALPWYAVLVLPVLFAAGMSLFDTLDGVAMDAAYGWSAGRPLRRVTYRAVITGVSVVVALGVGTVQLVAALGGSGQAVVAEVVAVVGDHSAWLGLAVVAVFAAVWAGAAARERVRRREAPACEG